jgi:hypothetical protein
VTVDRPESDVAAPSGHHSTLSFSKVGRADPHAVLREAAASNCPRGRLQGHRSLP